MKVLYEDNHLLVVDKPAGMATMGSESGRATVYDWAADYLKRRYNKPGNVFVGIVSRLDQSTTGVLVLARTSKAASRLSVQFGGPGKSKKVSSRAQKVYLAVVAGDVVRDSGMPRSGTLVDWVWKDDAAFRMRVARTQPGHQQHGNPQQPDAKEARLAYHVIEHGPARSLLAVQLLTGRKHQIRLQFADRGHPILGDSKYGSTVNFSSGVALHSWRLLITHPTKQDPMWLGAAIPASWDRITPPLPSETGLERTLAEQCAWYSRLNPPAKPES